MNSIIGLDIGGTKIEGILWRGGKILDSKKIKTPKSRKQFLKAVAQLIQDLKSSRRIQGIGISCAGAIEKKTGKIINSPNMKFLNGLRLSNALSKKFRVVARIENDTNCFLLGEYYFGAARGKRNVVALTLGTGVGGAVLIDGKMLRGRHGSGGELGHIVIHDRQSLEDLTSSHIFKKYKMGGALEVQHKAEGGNLKARQIYRELGKYLGLELASLINIFDPELIILGGGISRGSHLFLRQALVEVKKFCMLPSRLLPPIKISKLKHAGALGAISMFMKS